MSMFAERLAQGQTVKQGDAIGYVGKTGWATGPHLHYEYRVANRPIDPFSADIPVANAIRDMDRPAFEAQVDALKSRFSLLSRPNPVGTGLALPQNTASE